jgi:hypothetical protein
VIVTWIDINKISLLILVSHVYFLILFSDLYFICLNPKNTVHIHFSLSFFFHYLIIKDNIDSLYLLLDNQMIILS